jgi:ferredoxin
MLAQVLLALGLLSVVLAFAMTLVGVGALWGQRAGRKALPPQSPAVPAIPLTAAVAGATQAPSVVLEGKGALPLEQGVLLNTLWEHLPNADCQEGECGGCKVRLLEGQVRWVREPVAQFDRSTHILACSCEPLGPVRCAVDGAVA